jgi:uncharacterized membrane protein YfcA
MSVGNIRQGYFFKRGYTLTEIQGTMSVVFISTGIANLVGRYFTGTTDFTLALKVLPLMPFCFLAIYFGRKIVKKMPLIWQKRIIVYTLVISLVSVIPKLF